MKRKVTIAIAIIISVLVIIGIIYLYNNNIFDKKEKVITETNENIIEEGRQKENDIKAVNYCNDNLDKIYDKIVEVKNNSFIKKYYPEQFDEIKKANIDCSLSYYKHYINYYYFNVYTDSMDKSGSPLLFRFDLNTEKIVEIDFMNERDVEIRDAFLAAKDIILTDYEKIKNKYSNYILGTFGDYDGSYDGGDKYIVRIAEYEGEDSGPKGKIICDYIVNFKTRTFERIDY